MGWIKGVTVRAEKGSAGILPAGRVKSGGNSRSLSHIKHCRMLPAQLQPFWLRLRLAE
jgi:hypothetical protein